MVTGNEYVFENIDEALKYVLEMEQKALAADRYRQKPPFGIRPIKGMFSQPFSEELARMAIVPADSLAYPLSAWFNDASTDKFVMTYLKSGRYSLKPNLRNRKYLYRGETKFHPLCKPNMYRNLKQHRFTAELLRGQEMKLLMLSHPLVQLLDTGVELCGKEYCFEMNLFGLTQHYYNKTSLLDLTSDPDVAAFFATTWYDEANDTYHPIDDENHNPGVLYYYNLDIKQDFWRQESPLTAIGLQVFPRSSRQKGFLYHLQPDENFNDVIRLNAVMFKHRADIANRICDSFNSGEKLFPDDILKHHWKKEKSDSHIVSSRTVLMNKLDNPEMTLAEVEAEVRTLGFEIQDYRPTFTQQELDEYYESVAKDGYWESICRQIHIPGDTDGRMMNELLSLPQNPKYRWAFERDDSHVTDYKKGFIMREYEVCLN